MPTLLHIALLSAPALAADPPSVAIVGVHQADLDEAAQVAASSRVARVVGREGFQAVGPDALAARLRGREAIVLEDAFLGRGRALLADGQSLYNQAAFRAALPVLTDAVDTLRHGVATANSARSLWEAWTLLGVVHFMLEDGAAAREAWAQAVALNPARTPSAASFPPNVIEAFAAVHEATRATPSTLAVTADAADVTVWLNGESQGRAPLSLDVLPGENHVVAKGDDGSHAYALVDVAPGGEAQVRMLMGEPNLGVADTSTGARSRQTASLYRALGAHTDVDLVLLAGAGDGSLFLQLYSPRSDAFSTPVEAEWAGQDPTAEIVDRVPALLGRVRQDGTFLSTQVATRAAPLDVGTNRLLARMLLDPAAEPQPASRKGPKAWTLAAVGIGAAVLGTGIAVALTTDAAPRHQGRIEIVLP